jgi:hypothetical protein
MRTGSFNIQVSAPDRRGSYNQPGAGYDQPGSGSGRQGYDRPGSGYDRPGSGYGRPGDDRGRSAWSGERARDLTRALYEGILMRDLDPGASGTIDAVRNGGYNALVDAAVSIANSNESRYAIPGRGVTAEQRLDSMYRSLLGVSRDQADPNTWRTDLRALNDGRIAQVAEGIVRSDRFRAHYNLTGY